LVKILKLKFFFIYRSMIVELKVSTVSGRVKKDVKSLYAE